jgi:glutaminyl-peptide cyclotransferase
MRKLLMALVLIIILWSCGNSDTDSGGNTAASANAEPPRIGYSVVNTYPHDTSFFTEGLEFHDGQLYEASGGDTANTPHPSAFGTVDLKTGKVTKKVELNNAHFFGEGISFFDGKIYQLTYKTEKGFIYDAKTFKKLKEFYYPGEGWSLTHNDTRLIMSTGSSNLLFINPATIGDTLRPESIVGVSDNNGPVPNINELEFINGFIYANQWQTNYILKIDPANGKVVGKVDLSNLDAEAKKKNENSDVLNGIAYNPTSNSFFVTGKLWPTIYEIKLN